MDTILYKKMFFRVCILFFFQAICFQEIESNWTRCHRLPGWILNYAIKEFRVYPDEFSCIKRCAQLSTCRAVYYKVASGRCYEAHWNKLAVKHDGSKTLDVTIIFFRNIKVIYSGRVVFSGRPPKNVYTFQEAEVECASMTGRLLTRAELQALLDGGYQRCGCGWLADGSKAFPMVKVSSCSIQNGQLGMIDCSSFGPTSGVWCGFD